jgi:hypothetical protein
MHIRKLSVGFQDIQQCEDALRGKDGLDPDVLAYPATTILVAEDGQNSAYMPIQTCYVMETLGFKDGTPDLALASAMKQFVSILVWEARKNGIGEILFLGNNEQTNAFALNNSFEEVPYKVFRLKTARAENPSSGQADEGSQWHIQE